MSVLMSTITRPAVYYPHPWDLYTLHDQRHMRFHTWIQCCCYVITVPSESRDRLVILFHYIKPQRKTLVRTDYQLNKSNLHEAVENIPWGYKEVSDAGMTGLVQLTYQLQSTVLNHSCGQGWTRHCRFWLTNLAALRQRSLTGSWTTVYTVHKAVWPGWSPTEVGFTPLWLWGKDDNQSQQQIQNNGGKKYCVLWHSWLKCLLLVMFRHRW